MGLRNEELESKPTHDGMLSAQGSALRALSVHSMGDVVPLQPAWWAQASRCARVGWQPSSAARTTPFTAMPHGIQVGGIAPLRHSHFKPRAAGSTPAGATNLFATNSAEIASARGCSGFPGHPRRLAGNGQGGTRRNVEEETKRRSEGDRTSGQRRPLHLSTAQRTRCRLKVWPARRHPKRERRLLGRTGRLPEVRGQS
jgi:hypothetical protein